MDSRCEKVVTGGSVFRIVPGPAAGEDWLSAAEGGADGMVGLSAPPPPPSSSSSSSSTTSSSSFSSAGLVFVTA